MNTPQEDRADRWDDCDVLDNRIDRIECRTSKLNDGFHAMGTQMGHLLENQNHMADKLGGLRTLKWATFIGLALTALKMAIDAFAMYHH